MVTSRSSPVLIRHPSFQQTKMRSRASPLSSFVVAEVRAGEHAAWRRRLYGHDATSTYELTDVGARSRHDVQSERSLAAFLGMA